MPVTGPTVRRGTLTDLEAVEQLEEASFNTDRLSRRSLRHFLLAPTTTVPVAVAADNVVGYAMVGFRAGSAVARVFSIAVDREHARQGIGGLLLRACEADAAARGRALVRLEVRADNPAAIALYRASGYREFGAYANYYDDGAAALRFDKALRVAPRSDAEPN